jgi:hypothetical protein
LNECIVQVSRQLTELDNDALSFGPPKSYAGKREVPIPDVIMTAIREMRLCYAHVAMIATRMSGVCPG